VLPACPVSERLSVKLRLVSLLAVLAVLFVHAYNLHTRFGLAENAPDMSGAPGAVGFVEYLVSQALCRWPVATLFAIAGFLFFRDLEPRWADYRRKFQRRLRTIVVPFLLWSTVGLVLYTVLQALPGSEHYFSKDFLGSLNPRDIVSVLLLKPVAYPIWFLQTLISCIAIAPLLYWVVRLLRWAAVVPFAALWVLDVPSSNWTDLKGITFFAVGAVIALEVRRGATLAPPLWVQRWLPPLWVAACVLFAAVLRDNDAFWAGTLHKGLMVMAVGAVWFGYAVYVERFKDSRLVAALLPFTFFIFVGQEPLMTIVKRLALHALGGGDGVLLAVFFAAPLVTMAACVGAAAALRFALPRPYSVLTGRR
jgi:hypothetical protein